MTTTPVTQHDRICGYCNRPKPDAQYLPFEGPDNVCGQTKFPICWTCEKEGRHMASYIAAA